MIRHFGRFSPIWVATGTVVASVLSLLFQTYLSLFLSDADFGAVSASIVIAVALAVLLALGSQNLMLDSVKRRGLHGAPILTSYLRLWLAVLVVLVAVAVVVSLTAPSRFGEFGFICSLTLLLALLTILGSERQSVDDFRGVGAYLVAPELAKCLAVVVVVILGVRELSGVYLTLAIVLSVGSVAALLLPSLWRRSPTAPSWASIAVFGLPYALSGLLFMAYYRATVVIFSAFGHLDEAGSLAIIYLFMTAILLLPMTYSQRYLLGRWHAISRNDPARFRKEITRQVSSILLFTAPLGIAWFLLSPWLLEVLYSERYELARAWAPWFAIVFVIRSVSIPLQSAASVGELRWLKTWVVAAAAATTIVLSVVLITPLGFASAFVAGVAAEVVLCGGLILIVRRYLARP